MATHSSTLAWKIHEEGPDRLQSIGLQRVATEATSHTHTNQNVYNRMKI